MTKAAIRSIVIIFWATLFFQALVMAKYKTEPYPTFRFPGFGGKVQTGGIKNFDQYEIYLHTGKSQDSLLYSLDEFLPDINYKKPTLDLITSKYEEPKIQTTNKKDFENWISENLMMNIPDKDISRLSILEVRYSYNLETNILEDDRELINYYNINLNSNE